ncbi:MAG: class A beta-lactamase [Proteobacteria bacterium]|nr:class A beta-lactamase [Pseudomonadota bacterium]
MKRRELLKGAAFGAIALSVSPRSLAMQARGATARLAVLEHQRGGRLGVAILDTGNGARVAWRGGERFLMCSTFKLLLVAAVLERVDRGSERLDRRVVFGKEALLEYAPVTRQHVGPPGMTIAQLCEAAITLSDNTAANLLVATLGGPSGVTRYARALGDTLTRLDHVEPELNRANGDDDTTTPDAMLGDLRQLLLGDALSQSARERLTRWLLANQTGGDSLRAGLPADWREGDKTGSGHTANNDVAILWPPNRKPLLVAAYYDHAGVDVRSRKAVLAEVGRIVATM